MKQPNILLLFSDQHNARALGCAGHPDIRTPHLDALAREGVRFESAWCQDGICVPSRSSLLSGQYPRTTGVLHNSDEPPFPGEFVMLQKHLRANGYRTGAFGKRHLPAVFDTDWDRSFTTFKQQLDKSDESYWDWIEAEGLLNVFRRDWNAEFGGDASAPMGSIVSNLDIEHTMEAYTAKHTIDFIREGARRDEPWFAWSSYYRPHQPYTPIQEFFDLYDSKKLALPHNLSEPIDQLPPILQHYRRAKTNPWCFGRAAEEPDLYRFFLACYYACVTEIDHHIGAIMKVLEETAQRENTIVIYTSDHGDFACHHGVIEKLAWGHNVYSDTLRVPLIVSWPKRFARAAVSREVVCLLDLYPTLLHTCGLPRPGRTSLPGLSLAAHLADPKGPTGRTCVFSENWIQESVITDRYTLGRWLEPPPKEAVNFQFCDARNHGDKLFDRQEDPLETNNLRGARNVERMEAELRQILDDWAGKTSARGKDGILKHE